jgi:hypothetical protein
VGSCRFRRYVDLLSTSDGKRLGEFAGPLIHEPETYLERGRCACVSRSAPLLLWRPPDAQWATTAAQIDDSECSRGQEGLQRVERRRPRPSASIAHVNSMSAGGLCSRGNLTPVYGQACASPCRMGAGTANRLDDAVNGGVEADRRLACHAILGQRAIDFPLHGRT